MRWGLKLAVAAIAVLAAAPAAAAAAPANDDFANREVLSGALPIETGGSNVGALTEPGEDEVMRGFEAGHSVWFEWVAPGDSWFTIGACDSDFAAKVGIFTGPDLEHLTSAVSVAAEGPACRNQRQYTFHAIENTHYIIRVDGQSIPVPEGPPPPVEGSFILRIEETPPPPNDNFAQATVLEAPVTEEPGGARFYALSAQGYNWRATSEPGEFTFGSGPVASVWYRWTAPGTAKYRFAVPCCESGLHWALFSGGSFDEEHEMVAASGFAEVALTEGTTYWLDIYGGLEAGLTEPRMGSFSFIVTAELPPNPSLPGPAGAIAQPSDHTAPQTRIDRSLLRVATGMAKFWFSASESTLSFQCRLDKGSFKPCGSPRTYKCLQPGKHSFRVKAVDLAGNTDTSAAVAHFKIPRPRGHR